MPKGGGWKSGSGGGFAKEASATSSAPLL